MWPQITYLILLAIGLMVSSYEHGKPKKGEHNIFWSLLSYIIGFWILYEGGFFNVFIK